MSDIIGRVAGEHLVGFLLAIAPFVIAIVSFVILYRVIRYRLYDFIYGDNRGSRETGSR